MKIASFETEHFFARHEFSTPYQLCNSDCESLSIAELLALAIVANEFAPTLVLTKINWQEEMMPYYS
jgi:hypothetical protein